MTRPSSESASPRAVLAASANFHNAARNCRRTSIESMRAWSAIGFALAKGLKADGGRSIGRRRGEDAARKEARPSPCSDRSRSMLFQVFLDQRGLFSEELGMFATVVEEA